VDTSKSNIYPVFIYNCSSSFVFQRVKYLPRKLPGSFFGSFTKPPPGLPSGDSFEVFEMPGSPGGSFDSDTLFFWVLSKYLNPVVRFFDAVEKKRF
jgi:hypothetical protein